jgi:hypothetical protein
MYLRYTTRRKDGKVHRTWRVVRSVRVGRRVIQQTVTYLGELDEGDACAHVHWRAPSLANPSRRICLTTARVIKRSVCV